MVVVDYGMIALLIRVHTCHVHRDKHQVAEHEEVALHLALRPNSNCTSPVMPSVITKNHGISNQPSIITW